MENEWEKFLKFYPMKTYIQSKALIWNQLNLDNTYSHGVILILVENIKLGENQVL